jgi:zinc transport system permease protein
MRMTEVFDMPFMQRALAAGLLIGLLSSYFGVFVVQRGLSFFGDGLAHAAFAEWRSDC